MDEIPPYDSLVLLRNNDWEQVVKFLEIRDRPVEALMHVLRKKLKDIKKGEQK